MLPAVQRKTRFGIRSAQRRCPRTGALTVVIAVIDRETAGLVGFGRAQFEVVARDLTGDVFAAGEFFPLDAQPLNVQIQFADFPLDSADGSSAR